MVITMEINLSITGFVDPQLFDENLHRTGMLAWINPGDETFDQCVDSAAVCGALSWKLHYGQFHLCRPEPYIQRHDRAP
jgi:hypothetical protein